MSVLGGVKGNRVGFYVDSPLHDLNNSTSNMFFNQSQFPRRAEKEPLSSHSTSQAASHLGALYSVPSVTAAGAANYFGSGLGSPGGLTTTTVHGAPGSSRGLTGSPQFSRSLSFPGFHSNHLPGAMTNASSGLSQLNNVTSITSSQPGSRGILSMGQRATGVGLPSTQTHIGSQSAFSIGSKTTNRAPGLPASAIGSGHSGLVGSSNNPLASAFGPPRLQTNVFGLSQSSLMNAFSSSDTISSVAAINSGLDLSDFPVLANRPLVHIPSSVTSPSSTQSSSSYVGRPSYGLVSKRGEPSTEFTMLNEDFPALPGTSSKAEQASNTEGNGQDTKPQVQRFGTTPSYEQAVKEEIRTSSQAHNTQPVKGKIQTSPSGTISNIPKHMVTDQFGMIGLLTFIRAAETKPNLVTLALGSDLTTLGLNLNSPESLYQTFGSPFSDSPCRPHEIDFNVPPEYRINSYIREKLAPIKLSRYGEDVLFYLYYTNEGDILQVAAAAELYAREWRYHKEERVWLTRVPGVEPQQKASSFERGTYYFFDYLNWRKIRKEFLLEYEKLEEKPTLQAAATTQ